MKYELDTIPVWEAYEAEGECPLCYTARKLEKQNISFFLGGSVMQPVIRELVNTHGFCRRHFTKLYREGQRLSVAILAQSHLLELKKKAGEYEKKIFKELKKSNHPLDKGGGGFEKKLNEYTEFLIRQSGDCALCRKSERALKRYTFTIIELWKKKEDFRKAYEGSRGFCFTHLPLILTMARETLAGKKLREFFESLAVLQEKNNNRMEEEIDWFIQKYDHRNQELPWKTSKDALPRIIQKMNGFIPELKE